MRYICLLLLGTCFIPAFATAEVCNPRDFTFEEATKIDFSDLAKLSAYSLSEKSSSEQKNSEMAVGGEYAGIKGNFSKKDAKSLSEYILDRSGYKSSRDTRLRVAATALSQTGAEMYKDCIGAKIITVTISPAAFSEKRFFMNFKWSPNPPQPGRIVLKLENAKADSFNHTISTGETIPDIQVTKIDASRPVEISLNISKAAYPVIYIPPPTPLVKFRTEKRYSASVNLVAECGSVAGCDSKTKQVCVTATQGILLPSTLGFEASTSGTGRFARDPDNSTQRSCATFSVIGTGWKEGKPDGRNEAIGKFFVLEAVPDTPQPSPAPGDRVSAGRH